MMALMTMIILLNHGHQGKTGFKQNLINLINLIDMITSNQVNQVNQVLFFLYFQSGLRLKHLHGNNPDSWWQWYDWKILIGTAGKGRIQGDRAFKKSTGSA